MDAALLDLMPHTISIEGVAARDAYGAPSRYEDALTARANVVTTRKKVIRKDGQESVARGVAYAAPVAIPADAAITVPTALGYPERMPVIAANVYCNETGAVDNVEVFF